MVKSPQEQGVWREAISTMFQPSRPTIFRPKGGGVIRGIGEEFPASPVTSTASVAVPVATSPSRPGFWLRPALSCDSSSGNRPSGLGLNLPVPAPARGTDKGLPRCRDAEQSDAYILSTAQALLPVAEAVGTWFKDAVTAPGYITHRRHTRIEGLSARIERWTRLETGKTDWRSITRYKVTTLYWQDYKRSCAIRLGFP